MKINKKVRYFLVFTILILQVFMISDYVRGQDLDLPADEMEIFLDGIVKAQINENRIPGAAVAVVRGGELILSKGYGYADLGEGDMVDPAATLFRPGSVSKLITWTAVMQLVEQGELDLDEDINTYLDFTIPGDEPITLRNIMTHTSGFEDVGEGLFVLSEDEMLTLEQYLKTYQPARVFPAGEVMAYSNYATGLAGYVVELVSEMEYTDYVEENIFQPLEMNSSTFRQPVPEDIPGNLAKAYTYAGGKYHQGDFEYISNNAAGAMSTTAEDMANFMLAHLQLGSFEDGQILQEETAREMHRDHFTHHPEIEGMALGFVREMINGEEVLSHTGATILYNSGLYLLPEHDLGIFISYSGGSPMQMGRFFANFMNHYFPEDPVMVIRDTAGGSRERKEALVGEYHPTRRNITGDEKLMSVFQRANVEISGEGFLQLNIHGDSLQFKESEPGLYQNRNQHGKEIISKLAFQEDEEVGTLMAVGGPVVYQKVNWYESSMLLGGLTVLMILLSLGVIIGGIRRFLVNKIFRQRALKSESMGIAGFFRGLTSLSILALIGGLVIIFGKIDPAYGVPDILFGSIGTVEEVVFSLPYLIIGLIAVTGLFTLRSWWKRDLSLYRRISYSIYVLAGLGFIWVLYYLNL